MPELHWRHGYLFALSLMFFIAAGLVVYFWRKGWLGSSDEIVANHGPQGPNDEDH